VRRTPAWKIASAACSGVETIQRVHGFSVSSDWGKPSVEMKPGRTMPTWTPCGASSSESASVQPISANLLAE
jgi:hypothetical protein